MTLDQRARATAADLQRRLDELVVPEPRLIVRSSERRRRAAYTLVAVAVMAGVSLTVASQADEEVPTAVQVVEGVRTDGRWTSYGTSAAGLPVGSVQLAAAGDGAVLAGGAVPRGSDWEPVIWRSTDVRRWSEVARPGRAGRVTAIAIDGEVALATVSGDRGIAQAVWRSDDAGSTWREVADGEAFGPRTRSMGRPFVLGITKVGDRWIAHGGASSGTAGVWTSSDGRQWREVLGENDAGAAEEVRPIIGGLVAHWATTAWRANPSGTWSGPERLVLPEGMLLLTMGRGATLAFGRESERHDQPTPLLRSTDEGRSWTVDGSFLDAFPEARVSRLEWVGVGWLAVGATGTHGDAWFSIDGTAWEAMPAGVRGEDGALAVMAQRGGSVVVFSTERYFVFDARSIELEAIQRADEELSRHIRERNAP